MYILLTIILILFLAALADRIFLNVIDGDYPKFRRGFKIFSYLSSAYSVIFAIIYGFDLIYFHDLRWAVFVFILLNVPRVLFLLYSLIGILPLKSRTKAKRISTWIGMAISIVVFILVIYGGLIGRTHLIEEQVTIHSERLPDSFDGFRILHFSDIHLGSFGHHTGFVQKVVDRINQLNPDIIFFTGDIVNDRSVEMNPFIEILSQLQAPYGVYSVLGNHDYGDYYNWYTEEEKVDNFERLQQLQRDWGWDLLNNEHRYIERNGDVIAIVGVENWGDPPFKQYGDLYAAYESVDKNLFSILLSHNPIHWREQVLPDTDIDLTLSGHTHAFQLRYKNISPAAIRYREWAGLFRQGKQYLYVNQGAGNTFYPMRIGAYPELTIIELRK